MVVGTSMATCLPLCTALKAARSASSVLPKPTSPQSSRSIGFSDSMSDLISASAVSWSGVSSKGKEASSSACQGVSGSKPLVRRLLEGERGFQLGLPGRVRLEGEAGLGLPCRIELEQVVRDVLDRLLGAASGLLPGTGAEPVQGRLLLPAAQVLLDPVEGLDGDEEPVALGVLQLEVLALGAVELLQADPLEPGHPVVDVHDQP